MRKKINDIICASVFLAMGIAILILVPRMTPAMKFDPLGSRFFPNAIGWATVIVSLIMGVTSFLSLRKADRSEGYSINWSDNLRAILYCLVLVLSVYLIGAVHFLVGSFVMVTAMLLLCKERKWSRYAVVYVCVILAYLLFSKVLKVRL